MEKGFESRFQNQQIDWQLTNRNPGSGQFGLPHRINVPSSGNMSTVNSPVFAFAARKPEEPCGWFYGLPRYRQGFTPTVNSTPKEEPSEPKKFLVFDQSKDRTTLIYSSTPMQYHLPKQQPTLNVRKESSVIEKHDDIHCSNSFLNDKNDVESEMHEDTEELRALLYSDDDEVDYSEDEEEQSTGHFPSTMTGFDRHELPDNNGEEVANSLSYRKRHKLDTGGYDLLSLEDTASSGNAGVHCSGDLVELGSGAGNRVTDAGSEASPAGKSSRKERVRETINILQNLIPGGKNGKDALVILDEAINYLRILKVKAKALGL